MPQPDYSISTPENVDLHLELAGMGNRILAALIDSAITYSGMLLIGIVCGIVALLINTAAMSNDTKNVIFSCIVMVGIFLSFLLMFFYFVYFEAKWQGQTPGKRVAQIRVIDQSGQPVSFGAVFIRNLLRVVDEGIGCVGLLSMLIDKNERRLGDLAAGTLVIRERTAEIGAPQVALLTNAEAGGLLDIGRVSPQEYEILISFLKRRQTLAKSQRPLVAKKLEEHFRNRLNEPLEEGNPEQFLERIYLSYKARATDS